MTPYVAVGFSFRFKRHMRLSWLSLSLCQARVRFSYANFEWCAVWPT